MSSMTRREALEANGGDGTLLDWTARFGTEEACEAELNLNLNLNLPRFRLHPYAAFRAAPSRCLASSSAGLRFPGAEWILALLQKASMYPKISRDACSRASKVPACTHSALMGPMSDSMAALPQGDEMGPIEGSMPASRTVPPGSSEAYRPPWSLRCAQPLPGRLLAIAVFSASSASPAPMRLCLIASVLRVRAR